MHEEARWGGESGRKRAPQNCTKDGMTPLHWIIQENQGDALGVRRMVEAVESDGNVAHLVRLTKNARVPAIPALPDRAPVVCHGPGFVTRAPDDPRLRDGLFFDPLTFRWSAFQAGWKDAMLSVDGRVMPLSMARKTLCSGVEAFIRPDEDSKAFEGGALSRGGLRDRYVGCGRQRRHAGSGRVTVRYRRRVAVLHRGPGGCGMFPGLHQTATAWISAARVTGLAW